MDTRLKTENMNLKMRIDELMNKLNETDRVSRQKDEALFGLSKELEKFKNTLNNYEITENALRREILDLANSKTYAEKQAQELKLQNNDLQSAVSRISEKLQVLERENGLLQNSIHLAKQHESRFIVGLK